MSWQQRSGHKYYYRTRREGRRVTHDYFGTGPLAWAVAKMDADERDRRKVMAKADAAMRQAFDELDAPLQRLIAASDSLMRAVMLSEGFYQHQRGPWRRRAWAYVRRKRD